MATIGFVETSEPMSAKIASIFGYVSFGAFVIGVFGIATNIINIVVFIKMGIRETVNLTLFSRPCRTLLRSRR